MTTISMMQVPMNDLKIQYKYIKAEIDAALAEVIGSNLALVRSCEGLGALTGKV